MMKNSKSIMVLVALFAIQTLFPLVDQQKINNFIENSRQLRYGPYFERGNVNEAWLLKAVVHILDGRLTRENKREVYNKLVEVADTLIGEPLRRNQNITDAQYNEITSRIERTIESFMS